MMNKNWLSLVEKTKVIKVPKVINEDVGSVKLGYNYGVNYDIEHISVHIPKIFKDQLALYHTESDGSIVFDKVYTDDLFNRGLSDFYDEDALSIAVNQHKMDTKFMLSHIVVVIKKTNGSRLVAHLTHGDINSRLIIDKTGLKIVKMETSHIYGKQRLTHFIDISEDTYNKFINSPDFMYSTVDDVNTDLNVLLLESLGVESNREMVVKLYTMMEENGVFKQDNIKLIEQSTNNIVNVEDHTNVLVLKDIKDKGLGKNFNIDKLEFISKRKLD